MTVDKEQQNNRFPLTAYSKIRRGVFALVEWEGRLLSFLLLIGSLQICFELVLRYFFNSPTVWGLELTIYICSITYIMSGPFAAKHEAHIRIDVFYTKWPPRVKAFVDVLFAHTLLFIFCGTLAWFSGEWFWEAWTSGTTSGTIWSPPIWPMRLVIVVGSSLLVLVNVFKFIEDLKTALGCSE